MAQPPPAGVPNRVSPTAALIGRTRAGGHAPSGELVHVGRASPLSAASPWRLCGVSPHQLVTCWGLWGTLALPPEVVMRSYRGRDQGHS